jgi:tRNA-2-methylthio-N6-dimethylallyladenosine synthase
MIKKIDYSKIYIKTYGCQMNFKDSEFISSILKKDGYIITKNEKKSDIILINTCNVRLNSERKAIGKTKMILNKYCSSNNSYKIIIIVGCVVQFIYDNEIVPKEFKKIDILIGTGSIHLISYYLSIVKNSRNENLSKSIKIIDIDNKNGENNYIHSSLHQYQINKNISFSISIVKGCNMSCSYCCVPNIKGIEESKPIKTIKKEIYQSLDNNNSLREIVLLGQNVTNYGRDINSSFIELLEEINKIQKICRIRFFSAHPFGFTKELIEKFKYFPKLCNYVHIPVQSGSDSILKKMRRGYKINQYINIINKIRLIKPDIHISTDFIVGFPGESESDFYKTKNLLKKIKFNFAYVFKYSPRIGTNSFLIRETNSDQTKKIRHKKLLKIIKNYSFKTNQSFIGKVEEVLIESFVQNPRKYIFNNLGILKKFRVYRGRTKTFKNVFVSSVSQINIIGKIRNVKIIGCGNSVLYGEETF